MKRFTTLDVAYSNNSSALLNRLRRKAGKYKTFIYYCNPSFEEYGVKIPENILNDKFCLIVIKRKKNEFYGFLNLYIN